MTCSIELLRLPQQKELLKETLQSITECQRDNFDELLKGEGYWLLTRHSDYGIIGGVKLQSAQTLSKGSPLYNAQVHHHKGWMGHHLFFHLTDDVMEELEDDDLHNLMQNFYQSLFRKMLDLSFTLNIPYFCLVSSESEHLSASRIGQLPFDKELRLYEEDQEYIVGFLPIGEDTHQLFYKSHKQSYILKDHSKIEHARLH